MSESPGRLPLPVTASDRLARERAVREIARRLAAGRYRVPTDRVVAAVEAFYRRED